MELLLPKLGLILWTLIAFGIVFFILGKICMETYFKIFE